MHLIEERDAQRPFYLQVSFNAPHFPLAAPPEYLAKYRDLRSSAAVRAAMIDALDNAVGRILETLDEQGLRRNTLVVFLSDNGADQTGRNAPFRSGKGSVYEGGIHVPCLLRWPPELAAGSVSQQPISAQDLYLEHFRDWSSGLRRGCCTLPELFGLKEEEDDGGGIDG